MNMPNQRSLRTELEILKALAKNGESSQYSVAKEIGRDYHTVFQHFKHLKKKYVRHIESRVSEKGGKKDIYDITKEGILFYLIFRGVTDDIDAIAQKQRELWPLVFGRWDNFSRTGNKERARNNLRDLFEEFRSLTRIETLMTESTRNLIDEAMKKTDPLDYFTFSFYIKNIDGDLKDEKWAKMLIGDKEIMKYLQSKIDLLEQSRLKQLDYVTQMKNRLRELSSIQ